MAQPQIRAKNSISRRKIVSWACLLIAVALFVFTGPSVDLTVTDIYLASLLSDTEMQTAADQKMANAQGVERALANPLPASAPESLSDKLLATRGLHADTVWKHLIEEAANLKFKEGIDDPGIFVEVGMHKARQCLMAAEAGLVAHCVEPSTVNFSRVKNGVDKESEDVQSRVHLYHVAAGSVSGRKLQFHSGGGTGDRVGHVDVWKMEQNPQEDPTAMTEVTEMRMDDIVTKQPNGAFLMKIDTQGFEPHVFKGLDKTLQSHKAKFILLEYWPKGMDLMTAKIGDCSSVLVLQQLAQAGYTLYQLPVETHPKAPAEFLQARKHGGLTKRPLDDFSKNCRWYYDMEERFPSESYKMGYWSDILAVAPHVHLRNPTTALGKVLFPP